MINPQAGLDGLPEPVADALRNAVGCWDSLVVDLPGGCQVVAVMVRGKGVPAVPPPETRQRWAAFKDAVLRGLMDETGVDRSLSDDEVIAMYRELPARDRMVVGDLVESLHKRL